MADWKSNQRIHQCYHILIQQRSPKWVSKFNCSKFRQHVIKCVTMFLCVTVIRNVCWLNNFNLHLFTLSRFRFIFKANFNPLNFTFYFWLDFRKFNNQITLKQRWINNHLSTPFIFHWCDDICSQHNKSNFYAQNEFIRANFFKMNSIKCMHFSSCNLTYEKFVQKWCCLNSNSNVKCFE